MAWFEEYFTQDWMRFRDAEELQRKTVPEVGFLGQALRISPPAKLLDIGCGFGRHAIEFGARGYEVTGIDLSSDLLESARNTAEHRNVTVNWVEIDMRTIEFENDFDAGICLYTSFGYFGEEENLDVMRRISRALKKGARLVLDVENRDGLLLRYQPRDRYATRRGDIILEDRRFDPVTGRQITEMVLVSGQSVTRRTLDIRWYSVPELQEMLADSGLHIEALYGGLDGSTYDADASRLVVLAVKG